MTEPRTEAGRRLIGALGHPESTIVPASAVPAILAIEAEAAASVRAALDVERLALAIHEGMLHNERGGVDDDLAKAGCVQFGWEKSYCHVKALGVAATYADLAVTPGVPPSPRDPAPDVPPGGAWCVGGKGQTGP